MIWANEHNLRKIWINIIELISKYTGIPWTITSWKRNSKSHITKLALDIAPRLHMPYCKQYGMSINRNPMLNVRKQPYKDLIRIPINEVNNIVQRYLPNRTLTVFIEPDHLHMYLLPVKYIPKSKRNKLTVKRWFKSTPMHAYDNAVEDQTRIQNAFKEPGLSTNTIINLRT